MITDASVNKAKFEYTGSGYYDMKGQGFDGRIIATQGYDYGSTLYESYATIGGESIYVGNFKSLSSAKKAVKDYIKKEIK